MSELIDILEYYKTKIMPYKYTIKSDNSLTLEFEILPDNLCHLLFGTIEKGTPNGNDYKGIKGYENIKNGTITKGNLHKNIRKHARGRTDHFEEIHKLIEKPTGALFFNREIVQIGKHFKLNPTEIIGDFLLYKKTETHLLHLVLKNIQVNGKMTLVPNSFFIRPLDGAESDLFINKQKSFRVLETKKEKNHHNRWL